MQVAIFTANAYARDAIGNQVAEKLSFFLDRGADVRVYSEDTNRLHPVIRPYCHKLDGSPPDDSEWDFVRSADLVVVEYGQHYPLLHWLPLLANERPRIVFQYYGITPSKLWWPNNRTSLDQAIENRGLAWFGDTVITPSQFARRELQESTDCRPERVQVVPLPVDTDWFSPEPITTDLRVRLGLREATMLLFVGRLAPNKRLPVLVEALAQLRYERPSIHGVIIGDDRDVYQTEKERCAALAAKLGVAERVHFLGQLSDEELRDAYRSADVFVMPSLHEGFCVPVVEAMACGLPVMAARGSALCETVGDAGLTFTADDPTDLARQLRRVLSPCPIGMSAELARQRIAIVSFRYGPDVVGGAEASLRLIAETLHAAGHSVEVFTTCAKAEDSTTVHTPAGRVANGITVHRFRVDRSEPQVDFPQPLIRSTDLLESLRRRRDEFDLVITGPYLSGISAEVAEEFGSQTILVPCFHDEPVARSPIWRRAYCEIGGIWYHSAEEQAFAETELGFNAPTSIRIGTYVNTELCGDFRKGGARVGATGPYVVYAGRYILEKGLPRLLDYAARYAKSYPARFTFVFLGTGNIPIPDAPWTRDLGFVPESVKRDVMAGAAALIHLSPYESLSLVALEAWTQATPVIGAADCAVISGHLSRSGGGKTVDSYESFAATLDDLWADPNGWSERGAKGRAYVEKNFGDESAFARTLQTGINMARQPIRELMQQRGRVRAAQFSRANWRERFAGVIEDLLDSPRPPQIERIEVEPRARTRTVSAESTVLIPVRVFNRGTTPALATGPVAVKLYSVVSDARDMKAITRSEMELTAMLLPGKFVCLAMPVNIPHQPGSYNAHFFSAQAGTQPTDAYVRGDSTSMQLTVVDETSQTPNSGCAADFLAELGRALAAARRLEQLPDDYTDITQGRFAKLKVWIKRKLLGNFKTAYVDELSHQQTRFNREVIAALHELTECCATLDSAIHARLRPYDSAEITKVRSELATAQEEIRELKQKVSNLLENSTSTSV